MFCNNTDTEAKFSIKNEPDETDTTEKTVKCEPEILDNLEPCYIKQKDNLSLLIAQESNEFYIDIGDHRLFTTTINNNVDTITIENITESDCNNCQRGCTDFYDVRDNLLSEQIKANRPSLMGAIEIRRSANHGRGTFATRALPVGLQFGPYEDGICRVENLNGYSSKEDKKADASNLISNWIQYINYAKNNSERNLVAFQYKGTLHYYTVRPIEKDEELLVYYDESFAEMVDMQENYHSVDDVNKNLEPCQSYVTFGRDQFNEKQQNFCIFGEHADESSINSRTAYQCCYCQSHFNSGGYKSRHEIKCLRRNKRKKRNSNKGMKHNVSITQNYKTIKADISKPVQLSYGEEHTKLLNCYTCNFETPQKSILIRHCRTHIKGKFKCNLCRQSFRQQVQLDSHLLMQHPDQNSKELIRSKIYNCIECSFKTVHVQRYKMHMLTHKELVEKLKHIKKYACGICGYTTYRKYNYCRHLLTHASKKPYFCNMCNKSFNEKKHIDSHIVNRHSDSQYLMATITNLIHECKQCSYKCIRSSDLRRHIKRNH